MRRNTLSAATLLMAAIPLLAACAGGSSSAPTSPPATQALPSTLVTASPSASSTPGPSPVPASPTPAREAAADILVQLTWGRTRPEAYVRWGRVPEFALQENGVVFYVEYGDPPEPERPQLMVAHPARTETQELLQQVLEMSVGRLEGYTADCLQAADGSMHCAAGAAYSILEINQKPEAWHMFCNVADFANDPGALKAVRDLLQDYRRGDARPYTPEKAAVFIRRATAPADGTLLEWPLDPAWLAPPGGAAGVEWVKVASGDDLLTLLSVTGRNMGGFAFHAAGAEQAYQVYLVPWLPWAENMDPTDLTTGYVRLIPATAVPGLTPAPKPAPFCGRVGPAASRLVVEEHPLQIGPTIPQVEGPYFETADGDTPEIMAKNQCYRTGEPIYPSFSASVGDQVLEFRDSGDLGDELQVTLGGRLVYSVLTRPCAFTEIKGAWSYEEHWVTEMGIPTDQDPWFPTKGQIAQDGQDLNAACGYEESYNFALLGGRPFYFYRKQNEVGISYDGQELPLPYDEIPHYQCCSAGATNPVTYPNMVQFFGRRGEQWYYVEAYVPLSEAERLFQCPAVAPTPTLAPLPTPVDNPTLPAPGAAQTREMDGMVMLYVPAGWFYMGSPPGEPWDQGESPQHTVYLDAFWVDQTEVTNAQVERCVQAGACEVREEMSGYDPQGKPDYPVVATWSQAQAYCGRVGGRLPTEAEWEKAARGTDGRRWPWGNARPDCTLSNSFGKDGSCAGAATAVGSYPAGASPYGALDMAGNVEEWVKDWFDYNSYAQSPERNPQGPTSGTQRIVRGGNWDSIPDWVRCAWRDGREPEEYAFGFRCVVSAAGTP